MSPRAKQPTEREELLMAYGWIRAARNLQVDGIGALHLALDRFPAAERRHLTQMAEAVDESMRKLRMALARYLDL